MEKKIKITQEGPYIVSGDVPLKKAGIEVDVNGLSESWKLGTNVRENGEPYALCRCGYSKNKPFCDGSHAHADFQARETAERGGYEENAVLYEGETVDLLDNEELCAYVRFCDRGVNAWKAAIESGNEENLKLAIEECDDCASGRLTVVDKTGASLQSGLPEEIAFTQDTAAGRRGPLWVRGGVAVEGADGHPYERRERVTLCRCGQSANMPFCNGSHMECRHMEGFDV